MIHRGMLLLVGASVGLAAAGANGPTGPAPTFARDVAPILQKNCQGCHRQGEIGPMPLMTYQQVRPYAAAIKEAVSLRKMPPWYADPRYGHFANDRSLSPAELQTISNWASAGAPEGDPKDMPPPRQFIDGWTIKQKPNLVLEMPAPYSVPASGVVDYTYVLVPGHFDHDTWVQMAEVRPTERSVVHHVIAFVRPPGSKFVKSIKPGMQYVPPEEESDMDGSEFLVGYAPGLPATVLGPGRAKLIKAGSDIIFQLHYTPNGKPVQDQTKIGLFLLPADQVKERVATVWIANLSFAIPPQDPNYKVASEVEFASPAKVVSLIPHMHLRGKDFEFKATYPTGESEELLSVPRWDFHWQLSYVPEHDLLMPKGSKIQCVAHFDNSPNNPYNPDPSKQVKWGDQTFNEMMIGFAEVAVDKNFDMDKLLVKPKREEKPAQQTASVETPVPAAQAK